MHGIGSKRDLRLAIHGAIALALAAASAPAGAQERLTIDQTPAEAPAVDDADYQWIDDADALLDAIGDAPPDFTFAYDDGDVWGWQTETGHAVYAEPLDGEAIRYYYFEPDSLEPFLVQDDAFAFGYRMGRMIVAYDADGRLLSPSEGDEHEDLAEDLYMRGRALRANAQNERDWDAVDAGDWALQLPTVIDIRSRWSSGRDRHDGWRRWHGRHGATKWRGPLAGERQRRWAAGDRFRRWQQDGFRGPPPRFGDDRERPGRGVRPPRPGWTPGTTRPPRAEGRPRWTRPRAPVTGSPPAATVPGVERPQRPGRPGWNRPRPPATLDRPVGSPETRPRWRQGGPGRPSPRPEGTPPAAAPAPSDTPRTRPQRPGLARPPGFAPTERPHTTAPTRVQPTERPRATPPPAPPARVAPRPSERRVSRRAVEQAQ